jgi:hypothetical protein
LLKFTALVLKEEIVFLARSVAAQNGGQGEQNNF